MRIIETDILVIGSGLSGLIFALNCAEMGAHVLVTTKTSISDTATALAQGGIAAVVQYPDSIKAHVEDTLKAGRGLAERKVVEAIIRDGRNAIKELEFAGVNFDKKRNGVFELGMEGGHTHRRVLHVSDKTGEAIEGSLIRRINSNQRIDVIEFAYAIDIDKKESYAEGVYFYKDVPFRKKQIQKIGLKHALSVEDRSVFYCSAKVIAIATGGICSLYKYTVNPDTETGDGLSMAYRAGCALRDLEFVQFHPTALHMGRSPFFLISEAVRGEGAHLVTRNKVPIMRNFKKRDLEARDIVSQEIYDVMKKEPVFLDLTHKTKKWIKIRFSGIYKECKKRGLDISKDLIPIIPAAHYSCGGIMTNIYGETYIKGLFAIGEVASSGLHGANRLASNSLLESVVLSKNAAQKAVEFLRKKKKMTEGRKRLKNYHLHSLSYEKIIYKKQLKRIQEILWNEVGIIRTFRGLRKGLEEIRKIKKEVQSFSGCGFNIYIYKLMSHVTVAELIIISALRRKESRGCHYVTDYPYPSKNKIHTIISK
jgi:L-aspartate oxidase